MGTTIYYFTGTGNSLMVSRHIAAALGETSLVSIPQAVNCENIHPETECVGLVFPVYYFGIPLIVREFIKRLEILNNNYVFCVATCGGSTGSAFKQVSELLKVKGSSLAAGFKIVLPDNYILMYNTTDEEKQAIQFKAEKIKIMQIVEIVRNRATSGIEERFFEPSKLLAPIIYNHTKKFGKDAQKFWTNKNCNGCGSCKQLCPSKNIDLKENTPVWKSDCQQCLACIHWCPKQAIEFGKGTSKRKRYRNPEVTIKDLIDSAR